MVSLLQITFNILKNTEATVKLILNKLPAGAVFTGLADGKKTADAQQAAIRAGTKNGENL